MYAVVRKLTYDQTRLTEGGVLREPAVLVGAGPVTDNMLRLA
jgi:hypothetical protein